MLLVSAIVAVNGVSITSAIATIAGVIALILPNDKSHSKGQQKPEPEPVVSKTNIEPEFRLYRTDEFNRIVASLLANDSILVAGERGSGKSVLATAVLSKLKDDGFNVAFVEPATTKHMLLKISEQLGVETQSKIGKSLTIDQLKQKIENSLKENVAFLIVDDCQNCDSRFRHWLKQLKKLRVPILLLATDPPGTDVFSNMPPLILNPLPEYAILDLMEQTALERGLNLKNSDKARLQQRAGGNPMQAQRVIDEEYSGSEVESADIYMDITPLILIVVVGLMVLKFVGLGTNNHNLYLVLGIGAPVFLGVSHLLYSLPQNSGRVRR
ncbi:MAG: ATP-binding protein [Rhizonema sp. PD37]|nr:ATP-binding protein [Rhizonema sp. PD37]